MACVYHSYRYNFSILWPRGHFGLVVGIVITSVAFNSSNPHCILEHNVSILSACWYNTSSTAMMYFLGRDKPATCDRKPRVPLLVRKDYLRKVKCDCLGACVFATECEKWYHSMSKLVINVFPVMMAGLANGGIWCYNITILMTYTGYNIS